MNLKAKSLELPSEYEINRLRELVFSLGTTKSLIDHLLGIAGLKLNGTDDLDAPLRLLEKQIEGLKPCDIRAVSVSCRTCRGKGTVISYERIPNVIPASPRLRGEKGQV